MKIIVDGLESEPKYKLLKEFGEEFIKATVLGLNRTSEEHSENIVRIDLFETLLEAEQMFIHIKGNDSELGMANCCLNHDLLQILEGMQSATGQQGHYVVSRLKSIYDKYFETYD